MHRIYVVAGTYDEFMKYRKYKSQELEIPDHNFIYVSSVYAIKGLRDIHGFFIGTFEERPDIEEIKITIALANK